MRKHIFGFALFALILGSAIFIYQMIRPARVVDYVIRMPDETSTFRQSMPKDVSTVNATSVVVDVNTKKVYVSFGNNLLNPAAASSAKVVMFAANSGESVFETDWVRANPGNNSHLIFACGECASMSYKKNYYARIYFADAPVDDDLKSRPDNEKGGDYYFQVTSVLVNSGKNK
jgi:hypothetical protein